MPRQPKQVQKVGIVGLRQNSGQVFEEFLPELRWPRAGKVYQQMADNDPVIGAILYLAEMLIRSAEWRTEAASDSAEDKRAAEFLFECMNDMEVSWADTITEVLSMLTYGWSFHEILYKVRRGPTETNEKYHSAYSDGKFGWRGFPIRSQASWDSWEFDDAGEVVALNQRPEPLNDIITIPMEKGLLFRTRISRGNPEGRSLLRNAYRPYYFKQRFEEIEGIGIERDLAGLPVLETPEELDLWDDSDAEMIKLRNLAETLVSSVRRDSQEGLILPAGWTISLLSSGSSRAINVTEVIERYDNRIAITMLSDIVLIGNGSRAGSFAMADVKQSILSNALQTQLMNIADIFNKHAVPKLFALNNWNLPELPKIVPGQISTPSLKEIALMLRSMQLDVAGDIELNNYLRTLMSMPTTDAVPSEEVQSTEAFSDKDTSDKVLEQNAEMRLVGEESY